MTCRDCVELVDELVDGTAHPDVAVAVRGHLDSCAACHALFEDVSRIRTAAMGLGPIEPSPRVWAGIQGALPHGASDRKTWDGWQPLAAAAGFVLVASSVAWVASRLAVLSPVSTVTEAQPAGVFEVAEAAYRAAIEDLETVAAESEAPFVTEPALVTLQAGLADLDQVIGETRDQLAREPDDTFSQDSLLTALDSKVALLQDALALLDLADTDQGANP
ncbi:MAG TPA: zf-HC2 domain-containing protein [Vicinamibacterales bacterium]